MSREQLEKQLGKKVKIKVFARVQTNKFTSFGGGAINLFLEKFAPCQVGDILWVRETWSTQYDGIHDSNGYGKYVYKADGTILDNSEGISSSRWYPSIHMPKKAARIFLKVVDVRAEKLQDITEGGARKEGCFMPSYRDGELIGDSVTLFEIQWDSIYEKQGYGWSENPWVWTIEFERVKV